MSFKYGAYIKHFYYLKKGEVSVKNEFKVGDLVFEIRGGHILLGTLKDYRGLLKLEGGCFTYLPSGCEFGDFYAGRLFHATPENHQALVTLYGEDAVPEIPLRGSELTKKLLEKQKYVPCWVSSCSDEDARDASRMVYIVTEVEDDGFTLSNGGFVEYAVPVDMNSNEITEIE